MNSSVVTDREEFRSTAAEADDQTRVPVEVRTTVADPFEAYRRARNDGDGVFLETSGGQSGWSYFGIDPIERLQVGPNAVVIDGDSTTGDYQRSTPTLAALEGVLDSETLARGACEVPYPAGALGWLSYDIARELEAFPGDDPGTAVDSAVDDRGLPRLQLAVFDTLVGWESPTGSGDVTLHVTSCPQVPAGVTDPTAPGLDNLYREALDSCESVIDRLHTGDREVPPAPSPETDVEFVSDCGRDSFADRASKVKDYIRDGDTFQANISQRLVAPAAVHPVEAYKALREVNPAPYSGLMEFGWGGRGADLVSASPELLLERLPSSDPTAGDRLVTEPIAGTRPRGTTDEQDKQLETELTTDNKERAEHAMLVDLERNDLGKVCEFGTVDVSEYRRVDRYSEVMHLVSLVEGRARADVSLGEAIAATFPGGTITGAPKPRTMEIIDEQEMTRRGPYTGSMGIFGFDGRATLNIIIRTLTRDDDEYHLRVGAGIVHDSRPDEEYDETLDKGRALVTAIDEALGGKRLRVAGAADD